MKAIGFLLLLSVITSCSTFKKVKVENVDRIFLDYDYNQPNNYSTIIDGKVFVEMKTGEQIELPNEKGFKTSENIDIRNNRKKISIEAKQTVYDQNKLPVILTISDKNGMEVTSNDTILINFKSPLSLYFNSKDGESGRNGKSGSGKDSRGDGNFGENGEHGTSGLSAHNYDIWVWPIDSMYYFHVLDRSTLEVMRYQVFGLQNFQFSATGGDGGNGGKGGDGAVGRDGTVSGSTSVQPGNGGNGGDGGNAGNGGNGGSVNVYLHASASEMQNRILLYTDGGKAGDPGKAGIAGKGGTSAAGQGLSRAGYNGRKGNFGTNGSRGVTSISIQDFDPSTKK